MLALDPLALVAAADRVDAVAASLACLDVATPWRHAGAALPGSAAGDACERAADDLAAVVAEWAERLHDLAATARWVAHDAATVDHDVARTLTSGSP